MRRQVRVSEEFFEQLERKLGAAKASGHIPVPSVNNFLLHELPRITEQLADDYEGTTRPLGDEPFIRMWLDQGRYCTMIGCFVTIADDDAVEILGVDIDL